MDGLTELLQKMEHYAQENKIPIIQREAGAILTRVVKEQAPHSVLEIGTAIGYSTLLMAANLPSDGQIITIELDHERAATASRFLSESSFTHNVQVLAGNAGSLINDLPGPFDFVFLDAAKGQYPDYLEKVTAKLSDGAWIVADNVLFRGLVLQSANTPRRFRTIVKRLQNYLYTVTQDSRFDTTLYRIGDGLAVTQFHKEK